MDTSFLKDILFSEHGIESITYASQDTAGVGETQNTNTEIISKRLIESIHQLFTNTQAWSIGICISLVYFAIFGHIYWNKDKPPIQNRSPILMLMITIGGYFDSICKLLIISIPYTEIDIKCTLAIFARMVFYYLTFIFILIRIIRVDSINQLNQQIYQSDSASSTTSEDKTVKKKDIAKKRKQQLKFMQEKLQ